MLMEEEIRTLRKDRNVKRREKEIGKENPPKKRRKIEIEKEKLTEKEKKQSEREDTIRRSQGSRLKIDKLFKEMAFNLEDEEGEKKEKRDGLQRYQNQQ